MPTLQAQTTGSGRMIQFSHIPAALRERDQWVLWKIIQRDDGEPTKVPVQCDGSSAKSDDPATWTSFERVSEAVDPKVHAGIGYVFSADDPFTGIDLDGCRNAESGQFAEWAREILNQFACYAEVSPSKTGAKIFCLATSPFDRGRQKKLRGVEQVCQKKPAIEVYDRGRFFAVTGMRLQGPAEPTDGQSALAWLKEKYFMAEAAPAAPDFNSNDAIVAAGTTPPSTRRASWHWDSSCLNRMLKVCSWNGIKRANRRGQKRKSSARCVRHISNQESAVTSRTLPRPIGIE
jgi:hypothetical protein